MPNNINYKMMEDDLKELSGVVAIHNLHVWSLTLDKSALAVHLAIGMPSLNSKSCMATLVSCV